MEIRMTQHLHPQTIHHMGGIPSPWNRGDKQAIKQFFKMLDIGCRFDEYEEVWFNPVGKSAAKDDACYHAGSSYEDILDAVEPYQGGSGEWADARMCLALHFEGNNAA
jgi:hypothetical protein